MDIKKRLNCVIQKDKETNPKYLIEVIKSDLYYLINNYFEVDIADITLDIALENDKYVISATCLGDRMKLVKVLPN